MPGRDRPAGDVDYENTALDYAGRRRADPRIAAVVHDALGEARTVLNVGAGAGSYEPDDRLVLAVEPSARMRAQRRRDRLPAIDATAERLPLDDGCIDAAMAIISAHQWGDATQGLAELRRVAAGPVVVLTFDPEHLHRFWLAEYVSELFDSEARRFPAISQIVDTLGGDVSVVDVGVPVDCSDGFIEAFYARPHAFLDPRVRQAQSAWGMVRDAVAQRGLARLANHLASGAWDHRHGHLRSQPQYSGSLRLIVSRPTDHRRPPAPVATSA